MTDELIPHPTIPVVIDIDTHGVAHASHKKGSRRIPLFTPPKFWAWEFDHLGFVSMVRHEDIRDKVRIRHNAKALGITQKAYKELVDFCEARHNLTQ